MSKFEILCVTMNQKDFSKIEEMNIHSNVVFANQCDHTSYESIDFENYTAKMISTQTRGVGINRNLALAYASADICLLADDDVRYYDDMEQRVIREFDENPKADLMIFHLDTDDPIRKQPRYCKTKKWSRFKGLPWGGVRIAFRLSALKRVNIWFTTLFGGGAVFPSGEDSIFLEDIRRAGLNIYVSKQTIGTLSFGTSTWFTGHDKKYFFARGAFYGAARSKTALVWMIYAAIRTKDSNLSFLKRLHSLKLGYKSYSKMISYDE